MRAVRLIRPLLAALLVIFGALPALAETRVALVIGNAAYANATPLANPRNDARALADKLATMGFQVSLHEDLDGQSFRIALGEFTEAALNADIAMVFFAGHAIEMAGQNYLIPVDAKMRSEATAQFETVGLEQVMESVRGARKLGMVLLDACRNNPFATSMTRKDAKRAVSRGLSAVPVDGERGILISFAAEAGRTADDGEGQHSPYTEALLDTIDRPGMEVNRLFRAVRAKVREKSGGTQVPIEYAQLPDEEIFLVPAAAIAAAPAAQPAPVPAVQPAPQPAPAPGVADPLLMYLDAVRRRDKAALEAFVLAYPDHLRAPDARGLIHQLVEAEVWATTQAEDTIDGYRAYLAAFPDGGHAASATERIAALTPAPEPAPEPPADPAYTGSCTPLNGPVSVTGVGSDDTLFVRLGPGSDYAEVGELAFNATGIHVLGCRDKWCEITSGCTRGFSFQKYLTDRAQGQAPSAEAGPYDVAGYAAGPRLPVHAGPGHHYAAVSELPADATGVWVSDCDTQPGEAYPWCNISWLNVAGWMYGEYLVDGGGQRPRIAGAAAPAATATATGSGESCFDLWYARNAIFDARGYCFGTAEGQKWFDNGDCYTSDPALSAAERAQVDTLKAREQAKGC